MRFDRRRFLSTAATLAAGACASCGSPPSALQPPDPGSDVTALWQGIHADPRFSAPDDYRPGHVQPATLEASAIRRTRTGFEIVLPGDHPVPTPALADGRLFASGGFGSKQAYCFDAESGAFLWGADLDDDGPSMPAADEGVVAFNTESCTLFVLEASTGALRWSRWLGDPQLSAPAIAAGRVFSSWPGRQPAGPNKEATHLLGAFDVRSGRLLWQRWVDGDVIMAPVVEGEEVIAATFTGTVFRFRAETGELRSASQARATSAPVVVGKQLHFSRRTEKEGAPQEALAQWADDGRHRQFAEKKAVYLDAEVQDKSALKGAALALDEANGFAEPPSTAGLTGATFNLGQSNVCTLQGFQGSRILPLKDVHVACMGDEVVAVDPRTGERRWTAPLKGDLAEEGGSLGAPPIAAGGELLVATLAGDILRLRAGDGRLLGPLKIGHPLRYPPVVDGGRVYVGTQDSRLICVDTGERRLSGWPQGGANARRTGRPKT